MIRFFVRLILPLVLILFVRALVRSIFAGFRAAASASVPQNRPSQPPPVTAGGELRKDPVCGTYVSAGASVSQTIDGRLVFFCSEECRRRYRAA
jgi:YHS domain-containing protein